MKRTKKNQNLRGWLLTLALVFGIFLCSSEAALAAGTAKVVASSGKIRAGADTSSDTVASVKKGDKFHENSIQLCRRKNEQDNKRT